MPLEEGKLDRPDCQPPAILNYFNFFTEVEDEFVRRRGAHLWISPIDWALVETWKDAGIPLHVVLRGINKAFDSYDSQVPRFRKVNSVLYCQQAVEETFAEWSLSQVGSAKSEGDTVASAGGKDYSPALTNAEIILFIQRLDTELSAVDPVGAGPREKPPGGHHGGGINEGAPLKEPFFVEAVARARARLSEIRASIEVSGLVSAEDLERDLDSIDRLLMEKLRMACGGESLAALQKEAKSELRGYRNKMGKEVYDQTIENFVARRLRDIYGIPRLSLFYI